MGRIIFEHLKFNHTAIAKRIKTVKLSFNNYISGRIRDTFRTYHIKIKIISPCYNDPTSL